MMADKLDKRKLAEEVMYLLIDATDELLPESSNALSV